jgi:glycosyltransferase involved in cell wall biosynthesis
MARILTILPYVPWPADNGGSLRTLRLLEGLDARHDVTVLAVDLRGAGPAALGRRLRGRIHVFRPGLRDTLRDLAGVAVGQPLRYGRFDGDGMRRALDAVLATGPFELVHVDHLHLAPLIPHLRRSLPDAPVVLDEHNVESQIVERLAGIEGGARGLALRLHAAAIRRVERRAVAAADAVLCCSDEDARELRRLGARRLEVVPNGVDLEAAALQDRVPGRDLVFVGSLDWRPNALAAIELAREIWPLVRRRLAGVRLVLVGRNPPAEVRRLEAADVVVTGTVPSVEPWLRAAFATAMPLRAGSGTRLKVLEAAAAGVPIVATRLTFEGLPFEHGRDLLVADGAREFADAIVLLRKDAAAAARLAAGALASARAFAWPSVTARVLSLYASLLAGRTSDARLPAAALAPAAS